MFSSNPEENNQKIIAVKGNQQDLKSTCVGTPYCSDDFTISSSEIDKYIAKQENTAENVAKVNLGFK